MKDLTAPEQQALIRALLQALPDDPRHVELRGLLLCRSDLQLAPDRAAPLAGGFVFAPVHGLAVGYGVPPIELATKLRQLADGAGMTGQDIDLHLPHAVAAPWLAHGSVADLGENRIQAFTDPAAAERILDLAGHAAELIKDPSDKRLKTLPAALQAEFASLCPWPAVVAVMAQGGMASIAYAFVETETHFDISIDTSHAFRREGHAVTCGAALIRHQQGRGKRPVWIANEKNAASLALSSRLGFEDVGRTRRALLRCPALP